VKAKVIWAIDTAKKIATVKSAKYGVEYVVVPAIGGGFVLEEVVSFREAMGREDLTDENHVGSN
jgi:hypothetical protein